jgi:nicotinamidase/pyrazinamidase
VSTRPVLWDVDTQVDFVHADGKLSVPGAEELLPQFERLVAWAREAGIVHVASADDHELTDPEIVADPDWENTFPPHCLRGTRGGSKVAVTVQRDPVPLPLTPYPPGLVAELVRDRREILVLKKSFDVFTNPNAGPMLEALDPAEAIVFGVATDVCDDAAIMGLLGRGRRAAFVEDAARGLDEARTAACLARWRKAGVRFTTTDEVVATRF